MLTEIIVQDANTLIAGDREIRCEVGKRGFAKEKVEGDLKTPTGSFPLRMIYYRGDRVEMPDVHLETKKLTPVMGWCDAAHHDEYNRWVKLPFEASHEKLWREDNNYDVVIPIGYNDEIIRRGKGSAIFFHVASKGFDGTEGCVAVSLSDMMSLLPQIGPDTVMHIKPE